MRSVTIDQNLRRVVRLVAVLNLAYFGIEFAVARIIGSVSLFADSIDFSKMRRSTFLFSWRSAGRHANGHGSA